MVYTTTKLAWQKMLSLLKTDIIVQEMLQLDFPGLTIYRHFIACINLMGDDISTNYAITIF